MGFVPREGRALIDRDDDAWQGVLTILAVAVATVDVVLLFIVLAMLPR